MMGDAEWEIQALYGRPIEDQKLGFSYVCFVRMPYSLGITFEKADGSTQACVYFIKMIASQ